MAATLPFAHSRSQSALATPIHCSFLTLLDTPSTATLSPDSDKGSPKLAQHGYGAGFDVPKTATTGSRPSSPFLKRIRSLSSIAKRARRDEPVPPLPQRKAEFIALPPSPLRDDKGRRLSPALVKAIVAQPAKSSLKQLERERARQREREIVADVHRQFATWSWASASGSDSTGNLSLSSVPDLTSDDSRGSSPTIDLDSDCDSDVDMSCMAHETAVIVTAARYTSALELPKRRKRPAPLVPPPASRFVRAIADVEIAAKHLSMASVASGESLFPTFAPASPGAPVLPPSPAFPLDPIKLARGPAKQAPLNFAGVWQAPAEWDIRRDSAADDQEFVDLNPLPTPRVRGIRRLFGGRSARK